MLELLDVQRAFFLSDLHLRSPDGPGTQRFLAFLRERVAKAPDATLVLAGDLFDFWFGLEGVVPESHRAVVDALADLPSVLWLEGNHDRRLAQALGPEWPHTLGRRKSRLRWGGQVLHVEHGDRVDPRDRGQAMLNAFLDSPVAVWLASLLGADRLHRLGHRVTARTGGSSGYDGREPSWLDAAKLYAAGRRREGCDLTVLGHGHYLGWWSDGLICLGDWLHHHSYLELPRGSGPKLRRFEPQLSEDPVLASSPLGEIPR